MNRDVLYGSLLLLLGTLGFDIILHRYDEIKNTNIGADMRNAWHKCFCGIGLHRTVCTVVGLECRHCGKLWDKAEAMADLYPW